MKWCGNIVIIIVIKWWLRWLNVYEWLLTRTRSVSKLNLNDQSNLMSSCWSTSCRDPRAHHSDTKAALGGSARHPMSGFRFSCLRPCRTTRSSTLFALSSTLLWLEGRGFICTKSPCASTTLRLEGGKKNGARLERFEPARLTIRKIPLPNRSKQKSFKSNCDEKKKRSETPRRAKQFDPVDCFETLRGEKVVYVPLSSRRF